MASLTWEMSGAFPPCAGQNSSAASTYKNKFYFLSIDIYIAFENQILYDIAYDIVSRMFVKNNLP